MCEDKVVGKCTFRGTSVIDYVVFSHNCFSLFSNFQVLDVDNLFSDGHSVLALSLTLSVKNQDFTAETNKTSMSNLRPPKWENDKKSSLNKI